MNFDFPTILVIAAALTGGIWLVDAVIWAPRRKALLTGANEIDGVEPDPIREPLIVEYARSFFPIIVIVLLLRSFLVEPFRIPSGSMIPTLLIGDFILVNKYEYGLRLPVVNKKFVDIGEPKRGDVVVFRYPQDPRVDYIKRVVGLPGDRIAYWNKQLYINGEPVRQVSVGDFPLEGTPPAKLMEEYLGASTHRILVMPDRGGPEGETVVPEGQYFVMGDNRDNSNDSRRWGFVPEENLVGKAFYIWMSWRSWTSLPSWDRIGQAIR